MSYPNYPDVTFINVKPPARYTKEESMAPKNGKTKRFYVGSSGVNIDHGTGTWAKHTLAEAIEQAKALLESTGKEQFIVQVIKVVKRKPQPIVVENVK